MESNLLLAENGRVVIPANMRAALGWTGGSKILARLVDGTVVLEPADAAIRRAQAMVGQYVPAGAGLVEELIAERRTASRDE